MNDTGKRYTVFSIKQAKGAAAVWLRAGSAWVARDGSINVYLDVLPLDGRLHIREAREGEGPHAADLPKDALAPAGGVSVR